MQIVTKLEVVAFNEVIFPIYSLLELVCRIQRYQGFLPQLFTIRCITLGNHLVVQALGLMDFEKECSLPYTIIYPGHLSLLQGSL